MAGPPALLAFRGAALWPHWAAALAMVSLWGCGPDHTAPQRHVPAYAKINDPNFALDNEADPQAPPTPIAEARACAEMGGLHKLELNELADRLNLVAAPRAGELQLRRNDVSVPLLFGGDEQAPWAVALLPEVPRALPCMGLAALARAVGARGRRRST